MASNLSAPCSSSSTAVAVSHLNTKNGASFLPPSSIGMPSCPHSCKLVSHMFPRIQVTRCFYPKSTNGHPLNAVSLRNGEDDPGNPIAEKNVHQRIDQQYPLILESVEKEPMLSITVVGASGDLAKKKIFPALFALFYEGFLPQNFTIVGYARTKLNDEQLRTMISETLTCRIDKRENCEDKMDQFLRRCFYHAGQYNSENDFALLDHKLKEKEIYDSCIKVLEMTCVRCCGPDHLAHVQQRQLSSSSQQQLQHAASASPLH